MNLTIEELDSSQLKISKKDSHFILELYLTTSIFCKHLNTLIKTKMGV